MKHILSILFLFIFVLSGVSQELPKSYNKKLKKQSRKVERFEKKYDIVLTPEESIPLPQEYVNALSNKDWGLDYLHVQKYHAQIRMKAGKRKVLVVDFDTAGDFDHSSFDKSELPGYDFTGEGLFDGHGHGTHVGGTIASENANVGVGYILSVDGYLKIMPVKILHNAGYGKMNEIIKAYREINEIIKDYIEAGWLVIYSNSWGGSNLDPTLNKEFEAAKKMGVIIVTASGNNGSNDVGSPADSEYSEAIGAIDKNGKRASFSQYGEGLTFVAPGVQTYSTWPGDQYAVLTGTSMAAPHVTGVYALIGSYWPDATPAELKAHFRKYATDIEPDGYDIFTGYGVPIIDSLINNEPEKGATPDDPVDDPDDPGEDIIKEKRTITIELDSLQLVWGIGSLKDQRPVDLSFTIELETDLLADVSHDRFKEFTEKFFTRRGLMFSNPNADIWDVAKYSIVFYEMFGERANFVMNVKEVEITDADGRTLIRSGEGIDPKIKVRADEMPILFSL